MRSPGTAGWTGASYTGTATDAPLTASRMCRSGPCDRSWLPFETHNVKHLDFWLPVTLSTFCTTWRHVWGSSQKKRLKQHNGATPLTFDRQYSWESFPFRSLAALSHMVFSITVIEARTFWRTVGFFLPLGHLLPQPSLLYSSATEVLPCLTGDPNSCESFRHRSSNTPCPNSPVHCPPQAN